MTECGCELILRAGAGAGVGGPPLGFQQAQAVGQHAHMAGRLRAEGTPFPYLTGAEPRYPRNGGSCNLIGRLGAIQRVHHVRDTVPLNVRQNPGKENTRFGP
ncbi:hypothetical protein [Arthrobacter sp. MA-N2]|uniref:hypothetical protein n=1 Tax=Arthrobacter sp. MA-N2 TaxID=1101188 RepID=UPI0012DC4A17|nr:hypothetical protein [Arthrobacter sp. MA-N2]